MLTSCNLEKTLKTWMRLSCCYDKRTSAECFVFFVSRHKAHKAYRLLSEAHILCSLGDSDSTKQESRYITEIGFEQ